MGGSSHAQRQEPESHQSPSNLTSTDLPLQSYPSCPVSRVTAQTDSSGKLTDDSDQKKGPSQNQSEPSRAAGVGLVDEASDINTNCCASSPVEQQCHQPCVSRLSLFSGMELVTKGRPLCHRETDVVVNGDGENPSDRTNSANHQPSVQAPPSCSSLASDGSQPVSAFSFLNL